MECLSPRGGKLKGGSENKRPPSHPPPKRGRLSPRGEGVLKNEVLQSIIKGSKNKIEYKHNNGMPFPPWGEKERGVCKSIGETEREGSDII